MLAQGGEPTQPGGGGGVGGIEIQDVWLDREYVYVPSNAGGYVDEFIAQIDRFNDVWYVLQDANFNVLGLTDSGGELVEQRTYDPYGELLTRESFTAHPGFKAGHQGLFFDRLDPPAPVGGSISIGAASQLEPSTFGIYQVRNRVLIPRYGRWAQKDPNASGMLHASLWHDGQSPSPDLAAGSLEAMLGDGANLFAFVGNNPFNATDPQGLFGFVSGLMTGLNLFDTMKDVLDQAKQGVQSGASIVDMMDAYQSALYDMIEWALDPNAAWDEYAYGYTGSPSGGTFEAEGSSTVFAAIGGKKSGGGSSGWNPKTWIGRKHGGKAHHDAMQRICKAVDAKYGAGKVKFNQALKDPFSDGGPTMRTADGRSFRPDIQIRTPNNRIIIIEICHSQSLVSANTKLSKMKDLFSLSDRKKVTTKALRPEDVDSWLQKSGFAP